MKKKDETFSKFLELKAKVEVERRKRIQILRADRGGEYLSHVFCRYLVDHGIKHQVTMAAIPQQNEVSAYRNRALVEHARSMTAVNRPLGFL